MRRPLLRSLALLATVVLPPSIAAQAGLPAIAEKVRGMHGIDGFMPIYWDAATGRQVLSLSGGVGGIHTARFTADGTRLLLGSTDGRAWFADSVPYRERFATQGAQAGR